MEYDRSVSKNLITDILNVKKENLLFFQPLLLVLTLIDIFINDYKDSIKFQ